MGLMLNLKHIRRNGGIVALVMCYWLWVMGYWLCAIGYVVMCPPPVPGLSFSSGSCCSAPVWTSSLGSCRDHVTSSVNRRQKNSTLLLQGWQTSVGMKIQTLCSRQQRSEHVKILRLNSLLQTAGCLHNLPSLRALLEKQLGDWLGEKRNKGWNTIVIQLCHHPFWF